jgi:hypothetical protein
LDEDDDEDDDNHDDEDDRDHDDKDGDVAPGSNFQPATNRSFLCSSSSSRTMVGSDRQEGEPSCRVIKCDFRLFPSGASRIIRSPPPIVLVLDLFFSPPNLTFPVRAAHRTTEEFLSDLVAHTDSPLAGHRGTLHEFLGHCDLAKFARWQLSVPQMEAMLQSARDFILAAGQPVKARRRETPAQGIQPAATQA